MRALLIAAAREFNAGRYFEAHEVLEDALETIPAAQWNLCIGLIQTAVGYHKVAQQSWAGARRMLSLGMEKLEAYADDEVDLNLRALRQRLRADIEALGTGRFDLAAFRRRPPRLQPSAAGGADGGDELLQRIAARAPRRGGKR